MNYHLNWNFNLLYGGGSNNKHQWISLIHNGPMFPPEYKQHKIPVIINNEKIILPELAEEYATMYAKFIDTDYMNNNTFKKNFWKEFKQVLPKTLNVISLDNIDFSLINEYLIKEKEKKTILSKEEKLKVKEEPYKLEEPYKYCVIDNGQQQIGNFKIEPPGIFLGRGNHPKIGFIKKRIMPEDVTINLSKDAPIPKPNIPNHNWGEIIHDQSVIWLASWKDEITGKNKYIFTSLDSIFKAKSDESKFDLAHKLKKKVNKIRESYETQLNDVNLKNKQLATALYFIDKLALRVGGSKDTKEEADTVGVTSLRVEHIVLLDDLNVKLDFLGKDSIRYCKKIKVLEQIYNNLKEFINNKNKKDDLFDLITATSLNEYLTSFMSGLTAKVWRTYNASYLFQKEIDKIHLTKIQDIDSNEKINYLLAMFNQANTSVALLCNHQKNNKNNSSNNLIEKLDKKIKELKKQKKIYQDKKSKDKVKKIQIKIKSYKLKKETKIKMKNVSLGTSKNNYIDPRIIFAFIKKFDIPPEKIFTKVLLKRFEWANKIDKDYKF
jgi:DNA topoisomerase-1